MKAFIDACRDLLRERLCSVDALAKDNVTSGKGGPFAAQLCLFIRENNDNVRLAHAFEGTTNHVLETGVASCHAEAYSLSPPLLAELKEHLAIQRKEGSGTPFVVLISSAQPCPSCLTKIELAARHLVKKGLLAPLHFLLLYGAPYIQTEEVGGFHDYVYALDIFPDPKQPPNPAPLVQQSPLAFAQTPAELRTLFEKDRTVTAVLLHNGRMLGIGRDQRTDEALFRTAECTALHAASQTLKAEGHPTPWNLEGAELVTCNPDIGPLTYAECQWAAVSRIRLLQDAPPRTIAPSAYREDPDRPNHVFHQELSGGFNRPHALVHVVHDPLFANEAQHEWARHPDKICYNGHRTETPIPDDVKHAFDVRFCPLFLGK